MKIFAPNGYLDMEKIISSPYHFIMVLTGRGTGKTFGALDYLRKRATKGDRFMYFRRLQTQIDIVAKPEFSPFKKLDAVRHTVTEDNKIDPATGEVVGTETMQEKAKVKVLWISAREYSAEEYRDTSMDEFFKEVSS